MPAPLKLGVLSDRNGRLPGRPTAAWLRRALCIGVRQAHGRKARSPRSTRLPRPILARDCAGPAPFPCLEAHRIIAIEPLSCGWSGCKHDDRSHEEKRAHHHTSWHEADQSERVCRGHVHAGLIGRRGGFRYSRRRVTISCSGAQARRWPEADRGPPPMSATWVKPTGLPRPLEGRFWPKAEEVRAIEISPLVRTNMSPALRQCRDS